MAITLYNTRTRRKEAFAPLDPSDVRMYVCGPTVYDRAHIGNARPVVVFDVLYRLLRHEYGEGNVRYARNFTDVDDKINAKAAATGRPIRDITDETIGWYHEDMDALGALRPTHEPRATDYIAQMVTMIEGLIASGHAYAAEGHVLFEVATDPEYGTLARRNLDDMRAGARVEIAPYKRDPMDFVLWKPSDAAQPGWDSPWGKGRPGWHIECSAMAGELFGERFDIHGGGNDLQFPHHENECAQSRCAGHDFARVWMHNEMIKVDGKKMAKSLGNMRLISDFLSQGIPGEVLRFAILSTHYRSPMDLSEQLLNDSEKTLRKWRGIAGDGVPGAVPAAVMEAVADDVNTPLAIAALHKLANEGDAAGLRAGAAMLGLLDEALGGWDRLPEADDAVSSRIDGLLSDRAAAKAAKDFARSDTIRDALIAAGVEIKDTPQGAEWSLTPGFEVAKLAEPSDV